MYEINRNTLAVLAMDEMITKILEINDELIIKAKTQAIIKNSCCYFGSSFEGRIVGTKRILGISYKAPIIIEESEDIIFFPTTSPRGNDCCWLALKNIKDYSKHGQKTKVKFINNNEIIVDISYKSFDNQILRAARLQMLFRSRKIKTN